MRILSALLLVFCSSFLPGPFQPDAWFEKLPPFPANALACYDQFFPKGKPNVYGEYEKLLNAEISEIYKKSNGKSALISMLNGTHERDGNQIDFSKIKLAQDKALKDKHHEMVNAFLSAQMEYARVALRDEDSLRKNVFKDNFEPSIIMADSYLAVEKKAYAAFLKKGRQAIKELNAYMESKGYNAILNNHQSQHPYYVQLLEVRANTFDKIKSLNENIRASVINLATIVDAAKKRQ